MKEESVELICKIFWVCKLCICLLRFCVHLYVIRLGVLVGVLFLLLSIVCLVFFFFFSFSVYGLFGGENKHDFLGSWRVMNIRVYMKTK